MIEVINTIQIPVSQLAPNNGQIEGIPKNPRFIKNERYQKLLKSIQDNPEFLGARELIVYEHNGKFVVLCGNMRYRASKELGFDSIPCKVIPEYFSIEQIKAIIIKDNISFGDDDTDALANEWDAGDLEEWGMEIPDIKENDKIDGEIIFSNELDFESNYIVLKFSKDIDFINIKSILGLESTYSKRANGKSWAKGIGRVVDGIDAIIKIKES
jgi:hypothetical protein